MDPGEPLPLELPHQGELHVGVARRPITEILVEVALNRVAVYDPRCRGELVPVVDRSRYPFLLGHEYEARVAEDLAVDLPPAIGVDPMRRRRRLIRATAVADKRHLVLGLAVLERLEPVKQSVLRIQV